MRQELVKRSFRDDAAMAGAIFISNTATRELCFRTNIFGLPIEYQRFVENIREGMPLFLFDHAERKLYGVFEAASDGGLNIDRSAFSSIRCSYPAQVCFKIVWKCRPLTEDEFSRAIQGNYYIPYKFYFDLSHQQVIQLYQLFDRKRVEHPIYNRSKSAILEKEHFREETQEKMRLSPNIPHSSADRAGFLMAASTPRFSPVEASYLASTSMHQAGPQLNVLMPLRTNPYGLQIEPVHSRLQDQEELPYNNNMFYPDASAVDATAIQVGPPYSQTTKYHQDQFTSSQLYPLPRMYPDNCLPSGCVARDPTEELMISANHSYRPSLGYACSCLPPTGYKTPDRIRGDINYVGSTVTKHGPSYPQFPPPNAQGNATDWRDYYDCDVHCKQCQFGPYEDIHEPEHHHFSKAKALTPPVLNQQDIPVYPVVPESTFDQRKESFTEEDSQNTHQKHSFNLTDRVSPGLGNSIGAYMPDHLNINHDVRSEKDTIAACQHAQSSVFSRLSRIPPPLPQEIPGPSLNQLVHSLSQRAEQWCNQDKIINNDVCEQSISEEVMDIPCPLSELKGPSLTEEESTVLPFMNFKRRSETRSSSANLGKEISGKVKRRKLVRPSFGEDNNADAGSSGEELQVNGLEDKKHSHAEHDETKFSLDLNKPASADDAAKEDDTCAFYPSVVTKIHTDKPCEGNINKLKVSNATEAINKQDQSFDSATHTENISLDLNVGDLNTMDQSKLRAILGSSLLQAFDKIRSGELNNSEEAVPKICAKGTNITVSINSEGDAKTTSTCS
ncbi:uncharacterized protein LOC102711377 [Oryza brachyantha]|uniref:DCD domain-containing protein n=1 Tax=Oryza brachyantha TaxID=4533 RepID=J3N057_ORYBR|nr:uncharacterized protein LOC102711377 [Oryza brachyantha]